MQHAPALRTLRRPPCLSPRRSLCVFAALEPPSSPLQPPSRLFGGAALPSLQAAPPPPEVEPPPPPVAIEHSSAYALRNLVPPLPEAAEGEAEAEGLERRQDRGEEESVMSWALRRRAASARLVSRPLTPCRRADEELEEMERSKPPLARAAWAVSSKAGEVAQHPGVRAAAKLTAEVSSEFVRAAAPVAVSLGKGTFSLLWKLATQKRK